MSSVITLEDDSSDELEAIPDVDVAKAAGDLDEKHIQKPNGRLPDEVSLGDASTVTANSNEDEEKPLLDLMKHLINYNGKQTTKLTNNQLIGILKKEFDLDIANLHVISVDIYMNVLKKFLKDWPRWDEFDLLMHEANCMNDNEEVERTLDREYLTLKDYLTAILKASQPFAREAAEKLKRSTEIPESSRAVTGDVVMEINCTKDQLNTLFFRKPHPEYKSTIFNINSSLPSKISLNLLTLESILNSCYINLSINMPCFKYKRELTPNFKHTLVNKKLHRLTVDPPLNTHLQMQKPTKCDSQINTKDLKLITEKIQRLNRYSMSQQNDVETILRLISEDFNVLKDTISMPCTFRHYMSLYPYVRYLYKDVETHSEKYDLQLEEKSSPMLKLHIGKVCFFANAVNTEVNWLKLECHICQLKFLGVAGIESLKNHFRDCHMNEPNWFCVQCECEFTATALGAARWYHKCSAQIQTE